MKRFMALGVLALALIFGAGTVTFADEPKPAPTDEKDKKKPGPHLIFAGDEKQDEKKGDKGGK